LAAAGYDVTLAESADAALAFKEDGQSFDLIISDLEMPGMDGIAFAEHLKHDAKWATIPLVALSSYANPSSWSAAARRAFSAMSASSTAWA
ncbi:MAG: response regulator, partial [Methyloceanibacter sp.]|uniref:response regulator n=1 Tax=Methyloceanibacter sp. TaxID=1965321 RepID=UPI003D9B7EC9